MAIKFGVSDKTISVAERAKMNIFARWLAINYTTPQLNGANGYWWLDKLSYFEENVLSRAIENGSYDEMIKFIEEFDAGTSVNTCQYCGVQIDLQEDTCEECRREREYDLPF